MYLRFCSAVAAKNEQPHSYTTQQAYYMQHEPIIKGLEIWKTSIGWSQRFVFGHVLFQTSDNPQHSFVKGLSSKQRSSWCICVCVKHFNKHPEGQMPLVFLSSRMRADGWIGVLGCDDSLGCVGQMRAVIFVLLSK